jgi:uncharacterized protein YjbI with pentapeptide repeats
MGMPKITIAAPKLPTILEDADITQFESEATLEGCQLEDSELTATTADSVSLDEVQLSRIILTEAKLDKLVARDTIIKNCDFSAAQCSEISLQRVSVTGGRMTGWDCNKGLFKDVTFTGCKLDMANFRFAKLTNVKFIDCILTNADFLKAEMYKVAFEDCLLEQTDFNQCSLRDVDLRSSQLINVKGWKYMGGVIIDSVQLTLIAPHLADELGIKVVD